MDIIKPTLLVDESTCKNNIQQMAKRAQNFNCALRPHFKTHQSRKIGEWCRELGINRCAVSSLQMANYFFNDGWADITVAFPLNILEHTTVNNLAGKIKLNLCVESIETAKALNDFIEHPVGIFIKVDAGYHRTGIDAEKFEGMHRPLN